VTDYKATPEQWADVQNWANGGVDPCILELPARVEALEGKYETMRLATLEWGEDVDKLKRWSDQHLQRIMVLEAAQQPTVKEVAPAGSLVERVADALCRAQLDSPSWEPEARAARWRRGCARRTAGRRAPKG
jgi:hypothetical protein